MIVVLNKITIKNMLLLYEAQAKCNVFVYNSSKPLFQSSETYVMGLHIKTHLEKKIKLRIVPYLFTLHHLRVGIWSISG